MLTTEITTDNLAALIREEKAKRNNEFHVTMKDGTKRKLRLFVGTTGDIGYFPPHKRRSGYLLNLLTVYRVDPVCRREVPLPDKFRATARRLYDILTDSELWSNIAQQLKEGDFDFERCRRLPNVGEELACNIAEWKVKKMDFRGRYHYRFFHQPNVNENEYERIRQAMAENRNMSIPRIDGLHYDVSFRFEVGEKVRRAWYSEEYRNCGNGHYYLVIDHQRAIYYEKD